MGNNAIVLEGQTLEGQLKAPVSFSDQIEAFLATQDLSDNTVRAYRRGLTNFFQWLSSKGSEVPTRADIRAYKEHLTETYKASTAGLYLSAVRCFFQAIANETGRPELNIAANIRSPRKPKGHAKLPLTAEQAAQVVEASDGDSIAAKRNHAMTCVALYGCLRCIEIVRLDIEDIRPNPDGTATLDIWGKGHDGKDAIVNIAPEAVQAIDSYLLARQASEGRRPTGALFVGTGNRSAGVRLSRRSVSQILKDAIKGVGINDPRVTAHSIRHTGITLIIQGGGSHEEAQKHARHVKADTTDIYIHEDEQRRNTATLTIADMIKRAS